MSFTVYAFVVSPNAFDFADEELMENIIEYEQYTFLKNMDTIQVHTAPPKKKITLSQEKQLVVVDSIKTGRDTVRIIKTLNNDIDSLRNDTAMLSDTSKAGTINGSEDGLIFWDVDELPEFPGGDKARLAFIKLSTQIPEEAKKLNIKGRVEVQFVVTMTGEIAKVSIKKGSNLLLDNEALRVVKLFPKWKPAKRRGKPVSSWMTQPFNFQY